MIASKMSNCVLTTKSVSNCLCMLPTQTILLPFCFHVCTGCTCLTHSGCCHNTWWDFSVFWVSPGSLLWDFSVVILWTQKNIHGLNHLKSSAVYSHREVHDQYTHTSTGSVPKNPILANWYSCTTCLALLLGDPSFLTLSYITSASNLIYEWTHRRVHFVWLSHIFCDGLYIISFTNHQSSEKILSN